MHTVRHTCTVANTVKHRPAPEMRARSTFRLKPDKPPVNTPKNAKALSPVEYCFAGELFGARVLRLRRIAFTKKVA